MNLILVEPSEISGGVTKLTGRRAEHVARVLRPAPGATVRVGVAGGRLGQGIVRASSATELVLDVTLDADPPPRAPVELLLALPRPKILRKVMQAVASMGVARVALVGSYKVEKSYWDSPLVEDAAIAGELRLGLEQGRDTIAPVVTKHRHFKPFVEDELDATWPGERRLLADPSAERALARSGGRSVVAIGPEGGWTAYEHDQLRARGFEPLTLGPRILRVDVAVPFVVGQALLAYDSA